MGRNAQVNGTQAYHFVVDILRLKSHPRQDSGKEDHGNRQDEHHCHRHVQRTTVCHGEVQDRLEGEQPRLHPVQRGSAVSLSQPCCHDMCRHKHHTMAGCLCSLLVQQGLRSNDNVACVHAWTMAGSLPKVESSTAQQSGTSLQ